MSTNENLLTNLVRHSFSICTSRRFKRSQLKIYKTEQIKTCWCVYVMVCWKSWSDKHLLRLFAPGRKLSQPSCCRCSDTPLRQAPGSGWCSDGWPRGPRCWYSGRCGGGCPVPQARHPKSTLPGAPACPSPCTTATQTHWCCRPSRWMKPGSWGFHLVSRRRNTRWGTFY